MMMMMATPAALPSTSMQIIMQQQQQQQQPHGSQHNQHIPYASTSTYLPPPSPVVSSSYYAPPHHPQLHPHHRLSLHHPHRHAPSLAMDAVLRPNNDAFHIIKKSQRGRPSTKNPNQSSEKKQYPCDWDDDGRQPRCPKSFGRKSDLMRHHHTHTGTRNHPCTWPGCQKRFIQTSALTVHMRTHTGEKPHKCENCGKDFADSSSLARHRRIHGQRKPYPCGFPNCNKTRTHSHDNAPSMQRVPSDGSTPNALAEPMSRESSRQSNGSVDAQHQWPNGLPVGQGPVTFIGGHEGQVAIDQNPFRPSGIPNGQDPSQVQNYPHPSLCHVESVGPETHPRLLPNAGHHWASPLDTSLHHGEPVHASPSTISAGSMLDEFAIHHSPAEFMVNHSPLSNSNQDRQFLASPPYRHQSNPDGFEHLPHHSAGIHRHSHSLPGPVVPRLMLEDISEPPAQEYYGQQSEEGQWAPIIQAEHVDEPLPYMHYDNPFLSPYGIEIKEETSFDDQQLPSAHFDGTGIYGTV